MPEPSTIAEGAATSLRPSMSSKRTGGTTMRPMWLFAASALLLVVNAVLDLYRWPGRNLAILYAVPVVLASFSESAALVAAMSVVVILLDILSLVVAHLPLGVWLLTLSALVSVCFLALRVAGQRALIRHQVEEAVRAKWNQMLLAEVAHELRTPLTVILGYAQLLRRNPHLPRPLSRPVAAIEKSALQMRAAIDDLAERWKPGGGGST